jgi:hypothetical protein
MLRGEVDVSAATGIPRRVQHRDKGRVPGALRLAATRDDLGFAEKTRRLTA